MRRDANYRRHHAERIKRKVRGYEVVKMHLALAPEREAEILSKWEHTRPVCSCWMCGNPRKIGKPSKAEWFSRRRPEVDDV